VSRYLSLMKTARIALAAALSAAFLAACQPKAGEDKPSKAEKAFGESVRAYLLEHPEVLEEVVAKLQDKKRAEALNAHQDAQRLIPQYRKALERDPRDFVANPDGRITVVEFFDYNCGYCKVAAPEVLRIIEENPDVRFVFKEWPIFGAASESAARVALTPAAKAKGLILYKAWMAEKPLTEAGIDRHLSALGVDPVAARKVAAGPEVGRQISEVRDLAGALRLQGTPAFVVGDVIIPGADMQALRAAIAKAKAGGDKSAG
jgi:protein-disulfide isomerase